MVIQHVSNGPLHPCVLQLLAGTSPTPALLSRRSTSPDITVPAEEDLEDSGFESDEPEEEEEEEEDLSSDSQVGTG